MAAESKAPILLGVVDLDGEELAYPPVSVASAGGNRVAITNTLKKTLTVYHGGNLDAADPFTVPARGSGAPPRVTYDVAANSDRAGTIFQIRIEASYVKAFGAAGDPTIIIL